tara:strand:- start:3747 stop:4040 length:294 start_codon:yes stop_codon:yes gene_type:complete
MSEASSSAAQWQGPTSPESEIHESRKATVVPISSKYSLALDVVSVGNVPGLLKEDSDGSMGRAWGASEAQALTDKRETTTKKPYRRFGLAKFRTGKA